ncbi:leucine-rich repeat domain-containing protein [Planctomicrobium sp. SH661]|uniref:leucine-rich repeat domain-containing protein n=1 Tax=Planctomicrobium sp. SH661 TaxID=3448124 RepID=UPI003F5B51AB
MNSRRAFSQALLGAVLTVFAVGCEPKPEPPPPPPPPAPVVVTPPPQMTEPEPPPPPEKTADEVIDDFLAVPSYQRTDEMLLKLAELKEGLTRITELDLSKAPVTEAGLVALASFPRLRQLNLSDCRINNNALKVLPECEHLEVLLLSNTSTDSGAMIYVSQLPKLQTLSLSGTALSDAGFVTLKDLNGLEVLSVANNPNLYGREFGRLVDEGAFNQLKELDVNGTHLATYGADSLHKLSNLEVFRGQGAGVTDPVMASLGKCEKLRILDISNNPVTSIGIKKLGKLDQLEELNLRECRAIADIAFNTLRFNKSLRSLDVTDTACTVQAVQLLADKFLPGAEITFNNNVY